MLTLNLMGLLSVRHDDGSDRTPRGNKARALLAMLALAPNHVRPRVWLQDKLWSDREQDQASGSLRQTLTEIRTAFGSERSALGADGRSVWLDGARFRFDIDTDRIAPKGPFSALEVPELLEGIIVRDIEYQDWHRAVLQVWHRNTEPAASAIHGHAAPKPAIPPPATSRDDGPVRGGWPGPIRFNALGTTSDDAHFARYLSSLAMRAVRDSGFDVAAPGLIRADAETGFTVETAVVTLGDRIGITVSVIAPPGLVVWCESLETEVRAIAPETDPRPIRLIHEAADVLFDAIIKARPASGVSAGVLGALGARKLFGLGERNFAEAESLFAEAARGEDSGIYEAWLACLTAMKAGEGRHGDPTALAEEAEARARRANTLDPHNAQVLALTAHVFNFVTKDFFTGFDQSRRAIERNPHNPLVTTIHATSNFYLGRYQEADRLSRLACGLASNGPYRYFADTSRLIAAALAGDYAEALRLATVTHSLKPDYLPPLRYLAALNLKIGDHDKAARFLDEIRRRLPGYSLESMQENSASIPGYAGSDLFRFKARDIE